MLRHGKTLTKQLILVSLLLSPFFVSIVNANLPIDDDNGGYTDSDSSGGDDGGSGDGEDGADNNDSDDDDDDDDDVDTPCTDKCGNEVACPSSIKLKIIL